MLDHKTLFCLLKMSRLITNLRYSIMRRQMIDSGGMKLSSNSESKKYSIARAVADLYEAHEFLDKIAELPYLEMFIKIWKRDWAFVGQITTTGEPPQNALDLWFDFYVWTIS